MQIKFLLGILCIFSISFASSALMVSNPQDCPAFDNVEFPGVSCVPDKICGKNGINPFCQDVLAFSLSGPTTVSGDYSLPNSGYGVDCFYPSGSCFSQVYCQEDSSCISKNRLTECYDWGSSNCAGCLANYQACDGSFIDGNGCEVETGVTSRGTNVVYGSDCSYQCSVGYLDCNGIGTGSDGACEVRVGVTSFSEPNTVYQTCTTATCANGWQACNGETATVNGCNTQTGSTCTTGDGKPGTWVSGCLCQEVAAEHFITNTEAKGWGDILLFGRQFNPIGWLMNLTTSSGKTIGIDNESCIVFSDGSKQCVAGGGGEEDLWTNVSGVATYNGFARASNIYTNTVANTVTVGINAGGSGTGNTQVGSLISSSGNYNAIYGFATAAGNKGSYNVLMGYGAGEGNIASTVIGIGRNAAWTNNGTNAILIGQDAGYLNKGAGTIALGQNAGRGNAGDNVIALGSQSTQLNSGARTIAFGEKSGYNNSGNNSIFIGANVGINNVKSDRLMIDIENTQIPLIDGDFAGNILTVNGDLNVTGDILGMGDVVPYIGATKEVNLGNNKIQAGNMKTVSSRWSVYFGENSGGSNSMEGVFVGYNAGINSNSYGVTSVGAFSGQNNRGDYGVFIGDGSGWDNQGVDVVAIGRQAARYNMGSSSVILGTYAGYSNKASNAVFLGVNSGKESVGDNSIGIGQESLNNNSGRDVTAIGFASGRGNNKNYGVMIGSSSGQDNKGEGISSLGYKSAMANEGNNIVAIGSSSGLSNSGNNSIFIGANVGIDNVKSNRLMIDIENTQIPLIDGDFAGNILTVNGDLNITGNYIGKTFLTSVNKIRIGENSGLENTGINSILIGNYSGFKNYGENVNSMGQGAAYKNGIGDELLDYEGDYGKTGENVNAFGYNAAYLSVGNGVNAFGPESAYHDFGDDVNAIGRRAAYDNGGDSVNAIGSYSAEKNVASFVNAIGMYAAQNNHGGFVDAIGYQAGRDNKGSWSIAIGTDTGRGNLADNTIFIGKGVGANNAKSNRLMIDVENTVTPLIDGDFAADSLTINGNLNVTKNIDVGGCIRYNGGTLGVCI